MTTDDSPPLPLSRWSEISFLLDMPKEVDGFTVVEVAGFRAGGDASFATAIVIAAKDAATLATCRMSHDDEQNTWPAGYWHYDLPTLEAAREDAQRRVEFYL